MEAGRKNGKAVVVAGCVPQGAPKTGFLHGLSVVGVQQIDRVVEVVEETLKGTRYKVQRGLSNWSNEVLLPKAPFIAIFLKERFWKAKSDTKFG